MKIMPYLQVLFIFRFFHYSPFQVITANYVPVTSYHELFPDALVARNILVPKPSDQQAASGAVSNFSVPPPPAMSGYGAPIQPGYY